MAGSRVLVVLLYSGASSSSLSGSCSSALRRRRRRRYGDRSTGATLGQRHRGEEGAPSSRWRSGCGTSSSSSSPQSRCQKWKR
ncbi:hypothetical protein F4780DRAFT_728723 [Xylariomycetidae sp. FL0641]|nr:hypothetical protein F4780DRAFT_728723 [Xylariomycetidae sp. FL0641]